jgi:AraC-like DNA-binding protein
MPASALADRNGTVFDSTDRAQTEAFLSSAFSTPVKFRGDRENFRYRITQHIYNSVQFGTVDMTATIEARANPLPGHIGISRIHRGTRTDQNNDDVRLGPGCIYLNGQPGQNLHLGYESTRYSALVIPMHALADAARNRPDDELGPLRFQSLHVADPIAARRWLQTVHYVTDTLRSHPETMAQPLLAGAISRLLGAALLTAFPNTWTTEPHRQGRTAATATTLTRAIAFIETNPDLDITIVDIARAAYVTVRAVQLAFRRQLDTTPMAYLRRVRLDRAHEQLRASNPGDGTTIAEIAARWGFSDPSRFTALYRSTYGQPPSQTLRN